jgi:hypothetical protein
MRMLAADFIAMQYKRGRKSATQQEERLNRDVLPVLGDLQAREVTRGEIKSLLSDITDRPAPVLANRVHGIERSNATRCATHSDMPAKNRREPAINRLRFTDTISVFVDFAVRHRGDGEHDSLVIAVNLLGDWLRDALNPKLR